MGERLEFPGRVPNKTYVGGRKRRRLTLTGAEHFCRRVEVTWKQVPHPRYGAAVAHFERVESVGKCSCSEAARAGMSHRAVIRLFGPVR